jgi:hypothetical protein
MVILLVSLKVVDLEIIDTSRKDRNLNRGASTIVFVDLVLCNNVFFNDRHQRRASARVYRFKGSLSF